MANPATREQLKQYALRTLGKPVIEINVDDDQLEDRLDEALQYFAQYHYDGVERTYLKYKVTQADVDRIKSPSGDTASSVTKNSVTTAWTEQNNFIVVPEAVLAVTRIFPLSKRGNQNLFDIRYQLRLNDLYDFSSTSIIKLTKFSPTSSFFNSSEGLSNDCSEKPSDVDRLLNCCCKRNECNLTSSIDW